MISLRSGFFVGITRRKTFGTAPEIDIIDRFVKRFFFFSLLLQLSFPVFITTSLFFFILPTGGSDSPKALNFKENYFKK